MLYLLLTWIATPWLLLRARLGRSLVPQRVVVLQTAKIGDFIATIPVLHELRRRLPLAEITVVVHPVNVPLARPLKCINRVLALEPFGFRGLRGKVWLWRILGQYGDSVLVLSPNLSTFLVPLWAGMGRRVSVLPDRRIGSSRFAYPLLTYGEPHLPGRLFRDTALAALTGLAPAGTAPALPTLEIVQTVAGVGKAEGLLKDLPGPLVGLGIGAGNRLKAMSVAQLEVMTRALLERTQASLVLVGTEQDVAAASDLVRCGGATRVRSTAGMCSLDELPALLARLDCFIGVDSGATYIADAVGVPVVDFMGPADADDQRPTGPEAVIFRASLPCAPCSHTFAAPYSCAIGTRACISSINVSAAVDAVVSILRGRNTKK